MNASSSSGTFSDTYAAVTGRILDALEQGTAPWRRPWQKISGQPANALTGRAYRGVNVVLLGLSPYADHRWVTYLQASELGGHVRKGEASTEVVFWKPADRSREGEGEEPKRRVPLLRTYRVFNAEQCEGLRLAPVGDELRARSAERIPRAESVLRHMPDPPAVVEGQRSAWYAPGEDSVGVPDISRFETADAYYATIFHELGHATGHPARLNRPGVRGTVRFGSEDYSREELVAEFASGFLCAAIGLDNSLMGNSAAYVAGWLRALRNDAKAVVIAAGQAQRAADWIFGKTLSLAERS